MFSQAPVILSTSGRGLPLDGGRSAFGRGLLWEGGGLHWKGGDLHGGGSACRGSACRGSTWRGVYMKAGGGGGVCTEGALHGGGLHGGVGSAWRLQTPSPPCRLPGALLAFTANLVAQSSAQTHIHSAIVVTDTSNNA